MDKTQSGLKPFPVTMQMVIDAHRKVKTKGKAYGVDEVSMKDFEQKLNGNLYKIWNRLASGTYFPPAVREVEIPKKDGKMRKLGIPTVGDRIAQTVVKDYMFVPVGVTLGVQKGGKSRVGLPYNLVNPSTDVVRIIHRKHALPPCTIHFNFKYHRIRFISSVFQY